MDSNMGPYDQLVRIVVGLAAGWECFFIPEQRWRRFLLSSGFFMSGMLGWCPIYKLIGRSARWWDDSSHTAQRDSECRH